MVTAESEHFNLSDLQLHLLYSNILFKKLNNYMWWCPKLEN